MKLFREIPIGSGSITIESGELARQANGACMVRSGETMVLTTACMAGELVSGRAFLPLTVDYREYSAAAGRIPGGFYKREGRPTEKEIISCRLIDRPLRPLFPDGYSAETQIISLVVSADGENDSDILAINGASVALVLSNIPFYNPIGALRVGLIDDQIVFNPTNSQRDVSELDLVVVGTEEAVVMVEAGANQLPEAVLLDCIFKAHEELQKIIRAQHELFRESRLEKPVWVAPAPYPQELSAEVERRIYQDLKAALHTHGKHQRKHAVDAVLEPLFKELTAEDPSRETPLRNIFTALEERLLTETVLSTRRRFDERRLDEIRDITIRTGLLPRTHGSALFTRGETQAMVSATLGTRRDAQVIEEYEGETHQKFMLHYSFPPFSVGEVKFLRAPGRREIGHGVLARRALTPVLPSEEDFPYTIRVVSDILESNGSSSMATVCGGSLALFDAGVPMLRPVAGVAMGLIKEGDDFAVLTDIAGQEDHYGAMDFKVAGTREGVTALQMDIKITGVDRQIMEQALAQARRGRLEILDVMEQALACPRGDISPLAPRLFTLKIPRDKIREVIGPGGRTIRSMQEETGCEIEIEADGKVVVAAPDEISARRTIEMIERLVEVPEIDKIYDGVVTRVESYGAFVEILPGTEGLLHISELAPFRVREVSDILREGDQVKVKVLEIDPESRRIRLSRKAVLLEDPNYDQEADAAAVGVAAGTEPFPPRRDARGGERGGGGDRGGRGGRGGPRRDRGAGRGPRDRS